MIRFISILTTLVVCYFIYGIYLSQVDVRALPPTLENKVNSPYHDYRGVVNVRTTRSSGSSSPLKVIEEAKAAGLNFLVLTDDEYSLDRTSYSGYHGDLLVLDEREYRYLDMRLLLLSEKTQVGQSEKNYMALTDILSQKPQANKDVFTILAHPYRGSEPTWAGDFPTGIDAIEIMNPKRIASTAWENSKANVLWSLVVYPFNPDYGILRIYREPTAEFALWDKELSKRPLWGISGADASARAFPFSSYLLKFPRYSRNFSLATVHVQLQSELTGIFAKDRSRIFSALKNGQFYSSMDSLGEPSGFNVEIQTKDKKYPMGSEFSVNSKGIFFAELLQEPSCFYEIVLFKDGERIFQSNSPTLKYEIKEPGVYRATVRVSPMFPIPEGKKWLTWIVGNPIFVKP